MPRLAYETPCRPLRRQAERDRFLRMIKLATFVVAVGLFGGFYLLSGGSSREPGQAVAAVPTPPATTTPSIVAPPVTSTMTSEVVPTPAPPPPSPEPPPAESSPAPPPRQAPPRPRDERFAVVGEDCPRDGMYSMTERYEPVRCWRGEWQIIEMG